MMLDSIFNSIYLLLIATIIGYISIYIYQFYASLKHYPCGPKPLPVIGNLHLIIANSNRQYGYLFKELAQKYGGMYTFWLGSKPVVILNEIEAAKQAYNKNECSDRIEAHIGKQINQIALPNHKALILMNMNDEFKILRKVSIEAFRKYFSGNALSDITYKIVDETVEIIKKRESGKPFVPYKYINNIFVRILYEITFNKTLDFDNQKVDEISQFYETVQKNLTKIIISEYIPLYKMFLNTSKMRIVGQKFMKIFNNGFSESNKSGITTDNCQCLCDTHILAANQLRTAETDKSNYLTDSNLIGNLATLHLAGSDTSLHTFKWMLFLMVYYPDMQQRMRDEVKNNIAKIDAEKSIREKCHFVNAFICETLRFRNIFVLGPFHTTSSDTHIGNRLIPKGTMILLNHFSILNDHKYWENPDTFFPDRFLDTEQHFVNPKTSAYIPFGMGKRMCIGDKFAMNNLFLILTRLLQATDGMIFHMHDRINADLEPNRFGFLLEPKSYKLILTKQ